MSSTPSSADYNIADTIDTNGITDITSIANTANDTAEPSTNTTAERLAPADIPSYFEQLFNVSVAESSKVDFDAWRNILIVCREHSVAEDRLNATPNKYVFLQWNPALMSNSPVCRRLAKVIHKADVMVPNTSAYIDGLDLLATVQLCIVFPEPQEYFMEGYIETVEDFFELVQFADKYMLNMPYMCSRVDRMIWLLSIKERQKDIWRANKVLLTSIEERQHERPKFIPATASDAALNPYTPSAQPIRSGEAAKFITMAPIPKPKFLSASDLALMITLLLKAKADVFVSKLIAVLAPSIEYCDIIFSSPQIIKLTCGLEPFSSSTFYAFRVMYLEELAMYYHKRSVGRFIIPLDAAAALPNGTGLNFKASPYFFSLSSHTNWRRGLTLPCLITGARGLYTLKEFRKRMDIFTGGVLKYINWKIPGATSVLSGSLMTACAVKTPLETYFETPAEYFAEY